MTYAWIMMPNEVTQNITYTGTKQQSLTAETHAVDREKPFHRSENEKKI